MPSIQESAAQLGLRLIDGTQIDLNTPQEQCTEGGRKVLAFLKLCVPALGEETLCFHFEKETPFSCDDWLTSTIIKMATGETDIADHSDAETGLSTLFLAAFFGRADILIPRITSNQECLSETIHGVTLLHAIAYSDNLELFQRLVEHPHRLMSPMIVDAELNKPIHVAAEFGSMRILGYLSSHRYSVKKEYLFENGAPLKFASYSAHVHIEASDFSEHDDTIQLLTDAIDIRNCAGISALHTAAAAGQVNAVRCLVEHGATLNEPDGFRGNAPIHYAVNSGCYDMVMYLVEHRDVLLEQKNEQGQTALEIAVIKRDERIAKLLLKKTSHDLEFLTNLYKTVAQNKESAAEALRHEEQFSPEELVLLRTQAAEGHMEIEFLLCTRIMRLIFDTDLACLSQFLLNYECYLLKGLHDDAQSESSQELLSVLRNKLLGFSPDRLYLELKLENFALLKALRQYLPDLLSTVFNQQSRDSSGLVGSSDLRLFQPNPLNAGSMSEDACCDYMERLFAAAVNKTVLNQVPDDYLGAWINGEANSEPLTRAKQLLLQAHEHQDFMRGFLNPNREFVDVADLLRQLQQDFISSALVLEQYTDREEPLWNLRRIIRFVESICMPSQYQNWEASLVAVAQREAQSCSNSAS